MEKDSIKDKLGCTDYKAEQMKKIAEHIIKAISDDLEGSHQILGQKGLDYIHGLIQVATDLHYCRMSLFPSEHNV